MPVQQISYHAFAIQKIITYASKKLEEQVLDIVDALLLPLFSQGGSSLAGSFLPLGIL